MATRRDADEHFLSNLDNREQDALGYAVETLVWLENQRGAVAPPWVGAVDTQFFDAVTFALDTLKKEPGDRKDLAGDLVKLVAHWRNDIEDIDVHPLYELAKVLAGDPGDFLERKGPVFLLTMDQVLEGIAHEYLSESVGGTDDYEYTVLLLCVLALSVVAEACFWASKGEGTHLKTELERAFDSKSTFNALRGQLATLTLSGTALAWGTNVEFVKERSGEGIATPDLLLRRAGAKLYVECTTSKRRSSAANDLEKIGEALAHAWGEKRDKFAEAEYRPGLVTVDLSGMPSDRAAGVHLRPELVERRDLVIGPGRTLALGISHAREDYDLMQHESYTRGLIGMAASALNSKIAKDRQIYGIYAHYGQNVAVNATTRAIHRPIRGTLYWSAEPAGPEFELALRLALPPVSNQVPEGRLPPVFVQLV